MLIGAHGYLILCLHHQLWDPVAPWLCFAQWSMAVCFCLPVHLFRQDVVHICTHMIDTRQIAQARPEGIWFCGVIRDYFFCHSAIPLDRSLDLSPRAAVVVQPHRMPIQADSDEPCDVCFCIHACTYVEIMAQCYRFKASFA